MRFDRPCLDLSHRAQGLRPLRTLQATLRTAKEQMKSYKVRWEIDIEADSAREAAEKAREIQLDLESIANYFTVESSSGESADIDLDLMPGDDEGD